jgi:flavin reductase (DIM6/NTAB) family NADH-FMN oxidoreductase RutF
MIDAKLFRQAMGQFATGITVVTALDEMNRPCGITANAFSSVSLDPPLILVCVNRQAEFCRVISEAVHFNVNFLSANQESISQRFATRGVDKFADLEILPGRHGVPLLKDTLGYVECARYDLLPGGDHLIVLGQVEHCQITGGDPLLYFSGQYRWMKPSAKN